MSLSSQPGTTFRDEDRLEDAQAHIEHAKSHAINNSYLLGHATEEQATIWYNQHRFEEARLEALRAANIFYDLGSTASSRRSPWPSPRPPFLAFFDIGTFFLSENVLPVHLIYSRMSFYI